MARELRFGRNEASAEPKPVQNSLDHGWHARSSNRDTGLTTGRIVITPSRAAVAHTAVLAQCDALDGQTDGLIAAPAAS